MTVEGSTRETEKIGRYRVTGELGRGGMGVVYKGEDQQIGRRVAIKTLTDVTPELRERFYIEAKSGILNHRNIVTVYEVGEHEGRPFIVMEFVEGDSLEKVLHRRKRLPLLEALSIVEQICAGLGHAHRHGVVHRDVKPANVLVRPDGRVTIVDFGIARLADQSGHLTKTDTLLGTFHYIAPERLKGEASDGRADIWSVGVMLYEMVTGVLPFKGSAISTVYRVIHEPYVPVAQHVKDLPEELNRVLDKALAKRVEERYATAEDMAFDVHLLAKELKGEVEGTTRDSERTGLLEVARTDRQKRQRASELEDTQDIAQTIPLAAVKDGRERLAPANGDRDATGLFETAPRNLVEAKGQDEVAGQSTVLSQTLPVNATTPPVKPLEVDRLKENSPDLRAEHHRTAAIHKAVEKAVASCNKAIAANHLDRCICQLDDVANQYGESSLLAAAREKCHAKRSQRATQLLRDAMQMAVERLRSGSAKEAGRPLRRVEYALPYADADASSDWQRLKDECVAALMTKRPGATKAAIARPSKARWYAAGFLLITAALSVALVSYRRHEVAAAQKELTVHAPIPAQVSVEHVPTDMEINASPWARVVSVQDAGRVNVPLPDGDPTTPLRLDGLKSGKYKVTLAGADDNQQTVECNVSSEEHLCFVNLGSPDPDQVLTGGQP